MITAMLHVSTNVAVYFSNFSLYVLGFFVSGPSICFFLLSVLKCHYALCGVCSEYRLGLLEQGGGGSVLAVAKCRR
jgi:hypothetical protein